MVFGVVQKSLQLRDGQGLLRALAPIDDGIHRRAQPVERVIIGAVHRGEHEGQLLRIQRGDLLPGAAGLDVPAPLTLDGLNRLNPVRHLA